MAQPAEHHAKLTIHHLGAMTAGQRENVARWLEEKANEVRAAKAGDYAAVYTARLMK